MNPPCSRRPLGEIELPGASNRRARVRRAASGEGMPTLVSDARSQGRGANATGTVPIEVASAKVAIGTRDGPIDGDRPRKGAVDIVRESPNSAVEGVVDRALSFVSERCDPTSAGQASGSNKAATKPRACNVIYLSIARRNVRTTTPLSYRTVLHRACAQDVGRYHQSCPESFSTHSMIAVARTAGGGPAVEVRTATAVARTGRTNQHNISQAAKTFTHADRSRGAVFDRCPRIRSRSSVQGVASGGRGVQAVTVDVGSTRADVSR